MGSNRAKIQPRVPDESREKDRILGASFLILIVADCWSAPPPRPALIYGRRFELSLCQQHARLQSLHSLSRTTKQTIDIAKHPSEFTLRRLLADFSLPQHNNCTKFRLHNFDKPKFQCKKKNNSNLFVYISISKSVQLD